MDGLEAEYVGSGTVVIECGNANSDANCAKFIIRSSQHGARNFEKKKILILLGE